MPDTNETRGNPVVDSLENFYGLPIEKLSNKLTSDLAQARERGLDLLKTALLLRSGEFMQLYLEQRRSHGPPPVAETLPDGHLRAAFIGRELVDVPKRGRRTAYIDGKHLGHDRLPSALSVTRGEVKAALCYAHDLVLEDPFDEEQDLLDLLRQHREIDPSVEAVVMPEVELFVANVAMVADLAALARYGVVRFVPRSMAMNPRLAGRFASNAWDVDPSEGAADRELVDRMMRVWLHSGGTVVPFFDGPTQETRFAEALGVLASAVNNAEAARLRKLGTLALPAADEIDLRYMLDIRQESAFQTFRSRQRAVLAEIDASDVDDHQASALFREEMRAAAIDVSVTTGRQKFFDSLRPKVIGWSVGGVVAASFDWRAAAGVLAAAATTKIADFVGSSATQAATDSSSRGKRALHHHYVTLGQQPDRATATRR